MNQRNQRIAPRSELCLPLLFYCGPLRAGCVSSRLTLPLHAGSCTYPQPGVMSRREDDSDLEASEREPLAGDHNDSSAPPRCVPLSSLS